MLIVEDPPIQLIYEDNHLLVVSKPGNLLTQPSGTEQRSLEGCLKSWLKQKYVKPGNVFLHAVHRIDKSVSGIVVFAKTSKALSRLTESIRSKKTKKIYLALVEGKLKDETGTLSHYLAHDDFKARVTNAKEGKLSILHYKVIERRDQNSLVEIELETGRYHQIRAQFAAIGCPIVGDIKYGSQQQFIPGCIALHHSLLEIEHPITKEKLNFSSCIKFDNQLKSFFNKNFKEEI